MAGTRTGCFGGRYGVSECVGGKHFHIYSHPAKHKVPAHQRCSGRVSFPFTPFQAMLGWWGCARAGGRTL